MRNATGLLVGLAVILGFFEIAPAEIQLVKNGNFSAGDQHWTGVGSDDKREVAVVDLGEGKKGMKLFQKVPEGDTRIEQPVQLKTQTLYRFTVRGHGAAPRAMMRLRPESSQDKDFPALYKCWATSTAPMVPGENNTTSELIFDTGRKVDRGAVCFFLDGKEPSQYVVEDISLTEIGSSKPGAEKILLHLGDSITITSYLPFAQRVDAVIKESLSEEMPGTAVRQINYGADGETVKDFLSSGRYRKTVKENLERVDIVIIRYGANDMRQGTPEEFKQQLAILCDSIQKDYPAASIVLGTGPYLKSVGNQYDAIWQVSRDLAKERHFPLVDINAAFEKSGLENLTRSPLDQHPSPEGVPMMAAEEMHILRHILAPAGK